jgi:lycopene cyclase domain-containing protein
MTYFGFLLRFLVIPILILLWLIWRTQRRGMSHSSSPSNRMAGITLGSLILIAVLYTTPWDNYLVATGVWEYDPALVAGITLGWVPLEEYIFFILQPILTGLWTLYLAQRLRGKSNASAQWPQIWWISIVVLASLWSISTTVVVANWRPGIYISLQLLWALPPLMLQLAFGADILWKQRVVALLAILSTTFYLSAADWLAIRTGIWMIDPNQSFNLFLGKYLPVEEFIFFLLTNTLVVFGLLLGLATESRPRLAAGLKNLAAVLS